MKFSNAPIYAVSDFGLFCLPMSHKKDAKLIWVNQIRYVRRERLSFRSKEYTEELKVYYVQVFWARLASLTN